MHELKDISEEQTEQKPATQNKTFSAAGSRFGLWTGMGILLIPFFVYLVTLCPTVFVGDAGDFLTAAYKLGVPHPPGYPLYTLLGHFFMQLPIPGGISSPAYRMNMMSAIAAWAAVVFMFLFLRRVLKIEWAAVAGALALAFSKTFWEHAEIAEVYTLQVMFLTLMFYLAVLYVQEKKVGWALLLAFIMGLAISHQYAVLIFYPGILIFIGINGGLKLRWHTWILAVLLAIIGITPYAYLPLVHYRTPMGEVVFVKNIEEAQKVPMNKVPVLDNPWSYFWDYFSRRHYSKSRVYTNSPEALPERTTTPMVFKKFLQTTNEDFGLPLIIFAILGWIAILASLSRKKDKKNMGKEGDDEPPLPKAAFLMPALGYIFYFLIVHFYPSGDILNAPLENIDIVIPPLLIPLMCALAAIIGLGFSASVVWVKNYVGNQGIPNVESSQKFKTFAGLILIAAFSFIIVNIILNFKSADKSNSVISYYYAMNILDSCDPNAILITTGDETFLFWYLQECEPSHDPNDPTPGYRKDVWATNWIHNLPDLEILRNESNAMTFVTERFIVSSTYYIPYLNSLGIALLLPDVGDRPIDSTFVNSEFSDSEIIMGLDIVLQGMTYSFRRPGDIPDVNLPEIRARASLESISEGSAPMRVIDYFDSRPFANYNQDGLPGFKGFENDISALEDADYYPVNLEAQEREVLGRYQDSLYRFGIMALLEDTPEGKEDAVTFLIKCVSLDPVGWFGWKELGDALFASGRLDSAKEMYEQLIDHDTALGNVPPGQVAGAHAQLAHIGLIQGSTAQGEEREAAFQYAEEQARLALILNPEDSFAKTVLEELERVRARDAEGTSGEATDDQDFTIHNPDEEQTSTSETEPSTDGLAEFNDQSGE
jgi:tetratricopeptide (TPR) repeat protein